MIDRLPQTSGAARADIDPRTAYSSPQEIEDAPGLSAVEKQRLLEKWAQTAKASKDSHPSVAEEAEEAHEELAETSGLRTADLTSDP